jgi:dipeptidyl aminopeptidase/acylaminoacyl peptidase
MSGGKLTSDSFRISISRQGRQIHFGRSLGIFGLILVSAAIGRLHGATDSSFRAPQVTAQVDSTDCFSGDLQRGGTSPPALRHFSIPDAICMTRLAGSHYARYAAGAGPEQDFAVFSPGGRSFAIVIRKGNLANNTNEFSLLLFRIDERNDVSGPTVLAMFASSSNREGIKDVTWLDGNTLLFLGERPGEKTQLYLIACDTKEVRKLTDHPTNLVSYAMSERSGLIVYAAESTTTAISSEVDGGTGVTVLSEALTDLLAGHTGGGEFDNHELFAKRIGEDETKHLLPLGRLDNPLIDLALSPNGNYLIVKTSTQSVPASWGEYYDPALKKVMSLLGPKSVRSDVMRYEVIDIQTNKARVLIDAPVGYEESRVSWSPDSQSAVLTGVHLPLEAHDAEERASRRTKLYVVDVDLQKQTLSIISDKGLKFVSRDLEKREATFQAADGGRCQETFRLDNSGKWFLLKEACSPFAKQGRLDIYLKEGLNELPRVVARNPETNQERTVLDLNPQFAYVEFGHVKEIEWLIDHRQRVRGALYLPPDYRDDIKYPLVIQTHGYDAGRFEVDGPTPTAFAAQALANRGFVVTQVPDPNYELLSTPQEMVAAINIVEGVIRLLTRRGVIDADRIGIIGFSRTGLYVEYALIHSRFHFAAATVADGTDIGYFRYMAVANARPDLAKDSERLVDAVPFGYGLRTWLARSNGFQMDRINTPLQLQAIGPMSLLSEWELFSGLSRLGRPVDLLYLPDGTHILGRPRERLASEQRTVDWLSFWIKGEEDPDPAKAEQYKRWHELRKLQQENDTGVKTAPIN